MLETPAAKVTIAVATAGFFLSKPFGLDLPMVGIGMGIMCAGVAGRGFIEIMKTLDADKSVRIGRSLGWMGAGFGTSPFVSMTWFALLAYVHYPVDAISVLVLSGIGYTGAKGVTELVTRVQSLIGSKLPGGKGDKQE